jgi:hypothetical protein
MIQSCCCVVAAFAIPCDAEVPFSIGLCGMMLVDPFSSIDAAKAVGGAVKDAVTGGKVAPTE